MYRISIDRWAERGLRLIRRGDPPTYRRLVAAIRALADDPRPHSSLKLTSFSPPAWRLKVGGHRIVYEIDDDRIVVVVINVAPRGEVYR